MFHDEGDVKSGIDNLKHKNMCCEKYLIKLISRDTKAINDSQEQPSN